MSPSTANTALFDEAALTYDAMFSASLLGKLLRTAVHDVIGSAFAPGDTVLDLGCGTGEDARFFAARGVRIRGIDASDQMVLRARAKVRPETAEFEVRDLDADALPSGPFDGAIANFGVLNCLHDRAGFARRLQAALRPGARAFFVVMGRFCLGELLWHLLHAQPRTAFRRLHGRADFEGEPIQYMTPGELRGEMESYFRVVRTAGIGILLPPTEAAACMERHPRLAEMLDRLDREIRDWPLAGWISDHYLIEMERL